MQGRSVKLASVAVVLIVAGCGSPSGEPKERMTLIDIPGHHNRGGPDDVKTSWYRAYVLKTNALGPGDAIKVEVRGEVGQPGPISVARGTTVLEAIEMAGGFTEFALVRTVRVDDAKRLQSLHLNRQKRSFLGRSRVWFGKGTADFVLESGAIIYVGRGV